MKGVNLKTTDIKKSVFIIVIIVFSITNSTCRKVKHYSFSLSGYWIGNSVGNFCVCDQVYMDIPKSGKLGRYGGNTNAIGCFKDWGGTVRFSKEHIYIGNTKFTFVSKPIEITNGDTVYFGAHQKGVVTAEMTLMNSKLHGNNTYLFKRLIKY